MRLSRIVLVLFIVLTILLASCNLPVAAQPGVPAANPANPAAPAATGGTISGVVWHDLCAYSGGVVPNPLPPGCVVDGVSAKANGTREAGEPGIPGVSLALHSGDCVSPPVSIAVTDGNGQYVFGGLAPGAYCVTIDANSGPNNAVLQPGTWTKPTSPNTIVQLADLLAGATSSLTFDFGWDFKNQPVSNAPIPTAQPLTTSTPSGNFFVVDVPANCRFGPDTAYLIITSYLAGTFLPLVGRNSDSSWLYVQVDSTENCWISATTGHVSGSTASLPIVAAPPLPPTLTPTAPSGGGGSGDTTPPSLSGDFVGNSTIYYSSTSCGATEFWVAIHALDDHLSSVWVTYRFKKSGYTGAWNTLVPNDNASGGLNGFDYDLNTQAQAEMGSSDGSIQYQFFAKDSSGNQSTFPDGSVLSVPLQYCP